MASKLMLRSCGSSIRTLINRHLRPTVASTYIQTETPRSIYNCNYLPQTANIGYGFGRAASELGELARGRRNFVRARDDKGEDYVYEDSNEDDDEMEHPIDHVDDNDDYDSEDDDDDIDEDDCE